MTTSKWWVSWWHPPCGFELHHPWWVSGENDDGVPSVCAAIIGDDPEAIVRAAYDTPQEIKFRFIESKADSWSPFSGRFRRARWMVWP